MRRGAPVRSGWPAEDGETASRPATQPAGPTAAASRPVSPSEPDRRTKPAEELRQPGAGARPRRCGRRDGSQTTTGHSGRHRLLPGVWTADTASPAIAATPTSTSRTAPAEQLAAPGTPPAAPRPCVTLLTASGVCSALNAIVRWTTRSARTITAGGYESRIVSISPNGDRTIYSTGCTSAQLPSSTYEGHATAGSVFRAALPNLALLPSVAAPFRGSSGATGRGNRPAASRTVMSQLTASPANRDHVTPVAAHPKHPRTRYNSRRKTASRSDTQRLTANRSGTRYHAVQQRLEAFK